MTATDTRIEETAPDRPPEAKPEPDAVSPMAALRVLVEPIKRRLGLALLLSGLSGAARVAALVAAGDLVRVVISDSGGSVWARVGWMAVLVLLGTAAKTLSSTVSHHAAFDHEVMMRREITEKLGQLPIGVVQRLGAGGLKKVIQDDVRGLHALVADTPPIIGALIVAPVVAILAMFVIDWRLALVAISIVPFVAVLMSVLWKDHAEQQRKYDAAHEAINAAAVEYVQGIEEVRTFDGATDSYSRFAAHNRDFTDFLNEWIQQTRAGALVTRILLTPLPMIVLVSVVGVLMVNRGWVEVYNLVAILLLCPITIESVYPLMWMTNFLNQSKASASRIHEVLQEEPLPLADDPQEPGDGSVVFDGVTFSYAEDREPALQDVSFAIPDGQVCALVGPSGSGKSTVARLVPRFYDVTGGSLRVGNVDVRDMSPQRLLQHVALVFQEPSLIHASIRDNLKMARPEATDEEIVAAARAARAHSFIEAFPDGYDTVVGERGASLSGGERQRLTIARALLSDAQIVVLDEATSFADPENEAEIQMALAELTRGRTVLVVAHRLSTIVDADQIVVLDEGRVAEVGTHQQLVGANGVYSRLWDNHQRALAWGIDHETSEVGT